MSADQSPRAGDGKTPELPEPAFTLRWDEHSGQYKVNKPGIDYAECYTADQVRAALAAAPAVSAPTVDDLAESLAKRSLELAMANAELDAVRSLLWDDFPECCGNPDVTDHGVYGREQHCCGCPEPVKLNDAQIVASLRAQFKAPVQAPATVDGSRA